MISTGGRLRCLAAMVGGELLGMTPGEDVGGEERERELVPPPLRNQETTIWIPLYISVRISLLTNSQKTRKSDYLSAKKFAKWPTPTDSQK